MSESVKKYTYFSVFFFFLSQLSVVGLWCLICRQSLMCETNTFIFYQFLENAVDFEDLSTGGVGTATQWQFSF